MFLASKDATGRNHKVTVPLDSPVRFFISSKQVALVDEKGAAVGLTGANVPLTQPSGATKAPLLTFNVTGPR